MSNVENFIISTLSIQAVGFLSYLEFFIINIVFAVFASIGVLFFTSTDTFYYEILILEMLIFNLIQYRFYFKSEVENFLYLHSNQKEILEMTEFVDRLLPKNVNILFKSFLTFFYIIF